MIIASRAHAGSSYVAWGLAASRPSVCAEQLLGRDAQATLIHDEKSSVRQGDGGGVIPRWQIVGAAGGFGDRIPVGAEQLPRETSALLPAGFLCPGEQEASIPRHRERRMLGIIPADRLRLRGSIHRREENALVGLPCQPIPGRGGGAHDAFADAPVAQFLGGRGTEGQKVHV